MDPFSTAAAGVGLVGDIINLVSFIKDVKAALGTVDRDIEGLIKELETLEGLHSEVTKQSEKQKAKFSYGADQAASWKLVGQSLLSSIKSFKGELEQVCGNNPTSQGRRDAIKRTFSLRKHRPELQHWRESIARCNGQLQVLLQLSVLDNQGSAHQDACTQAAHLQAIKKSLSSLETRLSQAKQDRAPGTDPLVLAALQRAYSSMAQNIQISISAPSDAPREVHFDIPQPVDSCYVGREEESRILAAAFSPQIDEQHPQQKRFVVYGIGGSGKTQFCCKFAQDYQESYWGVFWIDGRSQDQLKQTLAKNVALVGGVDQNHVAALHWLSSRQERWLLIIDNADSPSIDLHEYLPKGGKGHVLITTRNPAYQSLGNAGPCALKFEGMGYSDASSLLLKTSGVKLSDFVDVVTIAGKIVNVLGYLALAINVAGSAIKEGVCRFQDYLRYFEEVWEENFQSRRRSVAQVSDEYDEQKMGKVETTFNISFKAIQSKRTRECADALQLLKTFAFMHCENLHFAFLEHCVMNSSKEEEAEAEEKARSPASARSWRRFTYESLLWLLSAPQRADVSIILPNVLRDARIKRCIDRTRIRRAMLQLTQYSLTTYNSKTDSWSMHPLVHRWARDSLGMGIAEQYVWCESAATLLSSCIVIRGTNDEELMRHLLPHIDAVQDRQSLLEERTRHERMSRLSLLPLFEAGFSPQRARMMAKFSIVYAQNGLFEKAEKLQRAVQQFTVRVLGYEAPGTRLITVVLAGTLWRRGLSDESAKFLEDLLDNCIKVCGPDHRDTYIAKLRLGQSRMQQGRVKEATQYCDDALAGLKKHCGEEHDETLDAMDTLAGVTLVSGTPRAIKEAQDLYQQTWKIRDRLYGCEDLKTLDSRQAYYTTTWWNGNHDEHIEAVRGLTEIIRIRREKLGRENPFVLLAELYLARIKVELEEYDAAEILFNEASEIGERNLGKDHVGVLYCRYHIGRMRVKQGRWEEARNILVDVAERQRASLQGWGRYHYDRVGSLLELARAHQELGEYAECDEVVAETIRGFERITTREHPWHRRLLSDWEQWKVERAPTGPPPPP